MIEIKEIHQKRYALIIALFIKHKSNKNGQTLNVIRVHMIYKVGQ